MKNLNKFLDKFREYGYYNSDKGVKYCLKVLRVLVKNPFLTIWLPSDEKNRYCAEFRSESGADFTIALALVGDYDSNNYIRYEFEIKCRDRNYKILEIKLGHIIDGIGYYGDQKSSKTAVMVKGSEISSKYGCFIRVLYGKVANPLQAVVAQNKLKNALKETLEETLEALKIPTV